MFLSVKHITVLWDQLELLQSHWQLQEPDWEQQPAYTAPRIVLLWIIIRFIQRNKMRNPKNEGGV